MIWWASQPSRARAERLAIAELQERVDWLHEVSWKFGDGGRLIADFEIAHLEQSIPFSITYPNFFPDMPPQVCPREEVRLSGHQYGAGGELCLEYRPDNWEPSFTGAMMIESAHRLLQGEAPSGDEQGYVESAHQTTIGQEVRAAGLRFFLPASAIDALLKLPLFKVIPLEVTEEFVSKKWLAFPRRFGPEDALLWDGSELFPARRLRTGYIIRLGDVGTKVPASYDYFKALVDTVQAPELTERFAQADQDLLFLVETKLEITLFWLGVGEGERQVYAYSTARIPPDGERLPGEYSALQGSSVAIVGCGSLGSKIAASLARAGVGKFTLVDGDLLFPSNLVRNDLDWSVVGLNKADAVAKRISEIQPAAEVVARNILLGGQESSAYTERVLQQLAQCQLIIDATAEPQIFNLCATVARNEKKPLVWGEVFGGGIGGLVMRLRPDVEPVPHAARRQVLNWCADHGIEAPGGSAGQYGLPLEDGARPLIADDADVSVIAAHMTRLTTDCLIRTESLFPQSAYAIGLKQEWIFAAPFDTWPIELMPEGAWGADVDERRDEELIALTSELFPKLTTSDDTQ